MKLDLIRIFLNNLIFFFLKYHMLYPKITQDLGSPLALGLGK